MEQTNQSLQVNMLGGFSLTYLGKQLKLDSSSTTKMMQLLALLLYFRNGIPRERLLYHLYSESELADSKNNLRVTVSRLRKTLLRAGLPEDNYVVVKGGVYRWMSGLDVVSDVEQFRMLADDAKKETDSKKAFALRLKACEAYHGEFLPMLAINEWVVMESVQLKNIYFAELNAVAAELRATRRYETLLKLGTIAASIYPYDEWQALQIDALLGMNQNEEAMRIYEKTTNLLFDEMGLPPSENLLMRFRSLSGNMQCENGTVDDIVSGLRESDWKPGAYYCSYPSFIDNYRMLERIIERSGQSSFLVICTLVGKDGKTLDNESLLRLAGDNLKQAVERSLRRGDTFTRYSAAQFLLLLVSLTQEEVSIVTNRISSRFSELPVSKKTGIHYLQRPVGEPIEDADTGWNFKS